MYEATVGRREKYQPIQYCWAGCLGYPVHTCHLPIDIQQIYCSAQTGQHERLRRSCCPVWALQHICTCTVHAVVACLVFDVIYRSGGRALTAKVGSIPDGCWFFHNSLKIFLGLFITYMYLYETCIVPSQLCVPLGGLW